MRTVELDQLKIIDPFYLAPWQDTLEARILSRDKAEKWVKAPSEVTVFIDTSIRNGNAGVGLYCPIQNQGHTYTKDRWG